MARNHQAFARSKQKKATRRRRREEKRHGSPASAALSGKRVERLHDAYALMRRGDYMHAEELLTELDRGGSHCPQIVEALGFLSVAYFQCGRSEEAVAVVEETRRLVPDNRFADVILAKRALGQLESMGVSQKGCDHAGLLRCVSRKGQDRTADGDLC